MTTMDTYYRSLKWANYSRKSSEDKDRQVLSLPAQRAWAEDVAAKASVSFNEYFAEERSAKLPYNRPQFDELVIKIKKGIINAIVCWKLDRLARNPEEAGIILGLLKRGELKAIITADREYRPEDNALISYVDFGMADQFVRDLSKNVKRGQQIKIKAGWRPGPCPIGYLNDMSKLKGERIIIDDPDRWDLIQRLLRLFLDGGYSVRKLREETIKWGLKTKPQRRQGGKTMNISHIYRTLIDPFYAGYFWTINQETGERVLQKGAHHPMITLEEFDLIQKKLGHKGRPRPKKTNLIYMEKMECGECGAAITGEEKYQIICSHCKEKFAEKKDRIDCPYCKTKIADMDDPKILHYIYFHCTKRINPNCTQKSVTINNLEALIDQELQKFNLSELFAQWALEELANDTEWQVKSQNAVIDSQDREYKEVVARLMNLTKLYTSPNNADGSLLSLEEYQPQRNELMARKKQLEKDRETTGRKVEEWIDWAENSFDFATAARVWFENGTPEQKRDIFFSLSGSNLVLKDKKLTISARKPLDFYSTIAVQYPSTTNRLEPKNKLIKTGQTLPFSADIPALRWGWDSNPRYRFRYNGFQDRRLQPLGHPTICNGGLTGNRTPTSSMPWRRNTILL